MSFWRRPTVIWGAEILAFVSCCLGVWWLVKDRVQGGDAYIVTPEQFVVTEPPAWIRTDVKRQVLQNASLNGGVSLLDESLVRRTAEAFPMHPWVEKVIRVQKMHPARVVVDLVYRQPVAMVVVPGGLYAVDVYGVLLPSEDFTADDAARYPRIDGISHPPLDQVGDAWGDPTVEAAARLAALLRAEWSHWQLARIVPAATSTAAGEPQFEVVTRAGNRIVWGAAPSLEVLAGGNPEVRLERLAQIAKEQGSLDAAGVIDLTSATAVNAMRPRDVR